MHPLNFNKLESDMQAHSIREYPKEACGIITKSFEYIPCKNISNRPKTSFVIDPLAILQHEDDIW